MKLYLAFILTALSNLNVVSHSWALTSSAAVNIPVVYASFCIVLFIIASPLLMIHPRLGLASGFLFSIAMLPFSVSYAIVLCKDAHASGIFFFTLPAILNITAIIYCLNVFLRDKDLSIKMPSALLTRFIFATIPLTAFLVFLFFQLPA